MILKKPGTAGVNHHRNQNNLGGAASKTIDNSGMPSDMGLAAPSGINQQQH